MRSVERPRDRSALAPTPRLTIAWHPDVSRIGEIAALETGGHLSRLEPEFAPARGGRGEPLADPGISRRPVALRPRPSGEVDVAAQPSSTSMRANGVTLAGEHRFTRGELESGVVLELADRVTLVLHLGTPIAAGGSDRGLLGESDAVRSVREQIERVAAVDVPVLIRGPTGSGKELVARAIHQASRRAGGQLVAVNLITLPPSTAASQLFGHVKGAFTGAAAHHDGFFVAADGGTLFLDEVGETPMDVQAMLLRALETGELLPVGATAPRRVDVRVIAATDADLERAVDEDRFRSPLLHRLAGYPIELVPLARRREDIGRLLLGFLDEELAAVGAAERLARRPPGEPTWLSAAQVARLIVHDWPGNVRELRNVARRLAIGAGDKNQVADGDLERALHMGAARPAGRDRVPAAPRATAPTRRPLEDISDDELLESLRAHRFKTSAAATALGISRTSLYARIEKHPGIRKARDLGAGEVESALAEAAGDVARAAAALEVSERGLKLRMRELELGG
jgi:two-component system nitrogen regulation response regulator GlnG